MIGASAVAMKESSKEGSRISCFTLIHQVADILELLDLTHIAKDLSNRFAIGQAISRL